MKSADGAPAHAASERRRRLVARWFVIFGGLAFAVSLALLVWALGYYPEEPGGSNLCTGPLGYFLGIGLLLFAYLVTGGLVGSGVLHFVAGWRYLAASSTLPIQLACGWDIAFWSIAAAVLGTTWGPLGVAIPAVLVVAHVRAALWFAAARNPSS